MSNTCSQTVSPYALRECGEKATHVVVHPGRTPRPMCLRHAVQVNGYDGNSLERISVTPVADSKE